MRTRGLTHLYLTMPPLPLNPYTKPAMTPTDLLAHLQARGLTVNDQAAVLHSLETVGYYRLLI